MTGYKKINMETWARREHYEYYTKQLKVEYNITANVDVKNSTITIKSAGTYRITGTLNNGQIIVNAGKDDTVTLILYNANINCSTSAPIYSKQSGTTVVYLADKSTNTLTDTATNVEKENSAIYAQDNLVIAGTGSLKITANENDGIKSKDDLVI